MSSVHPSREQLRESMYADDPNTRIKGNEQEESDDGCRFGDVILIILAVILIICTSPFSWFACIKIVQQYERAVIFRLGRLRKGGPAGPGVFCVLPCTDGFVKVDLRTVTFDVPAQEVLTKDGVTIQVDAVVYFRISDPTQSVTGITDARGSTQLLAQTSLRTILGMHTLQEILAERESIARALLQLLEHSTNNWGMMVERVEMKDVRLPQQLQRAMAAEAEAGREARAKVVAAEGEQKASRALKEAADVIMESPAALQLRYLQTLNTIAAEKNSTIIFPLPMEILTHFAKK